MSVHPQFSIRLLLLTVAAVAVVLALMFHVTAAWAFVALTTLVIVFLALLGVAFRYGSERVRPFCIGAAFPLAFAFMHAVNDVGLLFDDIANALRPPVLSGMGGVSIAALRQPSETNFLLGSAILIAIALGYLCVGFRWLIERQKPPESSG